MRRGDRRGGRGRALLALALLGAPAPLLGQAGEAPLDLDAPPRRPWTSADVRRWLPVEPRALDAPVPAFRDLARRVAAGTGDIRLLRAYARLYRRLYPFDFLPVPDAAQRALRARAAAGPPLDGCWQPLGPRNVPGRMTGVAIPPAEPGTTYAAGADGGVWRSRDGGASWIALGDFEASLAIGALAVDPVDPRVIYAGTGEGNYAADNLGGVGLLKSGDGGASWRLIPHPATHFHEIRIDPSDPRRLYAATQSGLFRSGDAGESWTLAGGGLPAEDATSVIVSGGNPSLLLAGIGRGREASPLSGLYRSTDGGASWSRVASFPAGRDGATGDENGRLVLAQAPADPRRLYAALASATTGGLKALLRSDDEGLSWAPLPAPPEPCADYCWYTLALGVDAADPDLVYLGGLLIYRSSNGGATWQRVTNTRPTNRVHVDQHQLVSPGPGVLLAANDGGIQVTRDGGETWEGMSGSLMTTQFYHLSADPTEDRFGLGGTQDNGTLGFAGSSLWSALFGGDSGGTAIDPVDTRVYYTANPFLTLLRSRDRGRGMEQVGLDIDRNDPRLFFAPFVLERSDPRRILAGTNHVWRSPDQGQSFTKLGSPPLDTRARGSGLVSTIDTCRDFPDSLWVGTSDGKVYHSADGGTTWADRSAGLPGRFVTSLAAHPSRPEVAYLSAGGTGTGKVYRTGDGGLGWTDVSAGLPDLHFNQVLLIDDRPASLVAAADLGVYRSDDEGLSWRVYGEGLPNGAVDWLAYSPGSGTLRAATHGRGVWQLALPGTCPIPPDFTGLGAIEVGPATDCKPGLGWEAALPTCPGAPEVRYNVYRGEDPLFLPGPTTLIARGLTGTSWRDDRPAPPGVTRHYIVRAEDGTRGGGGPANGGLEDGNLVTRSATAGSPVQAGRFRDGGGDGASWLRSGYFSIGDVFNTTPGGRYGWRGSARGSARYDPGVCAALETPELRLGPGAELRYDGRYNLEDGWDAVVVEISTDGGATWTDLPPEGGYPSDLRHTQVGLNACGLPPTRRAFSGPAGNAGPGPVASYRSDLGAYGGRKVRIRWLLSTDTGIEHEGFWLDEVQVEPVVDAPPGLGNVLRAVKEGALVRVAWSDTVPVDACLVTRGESKGAAPREIVGAAATGGRGVLDPEERVAGARYYGLRALPGCGVEAP